MDRGAPRVELQTTIGSFVIELYTDHAPKTCKNFMELTRKGYYNGTPFHRVIRVRCSPDLYQSQSVYSTELEMYKPQRSLFITAKLRVRPHKASKNMHSLDDAHLCSHIWLSERADLCKAIDLCVQMDTAGFHDPRW